MKSSSRNKVKTLLIGFTYGVAVTTAVFASFICSAPQAVCTTSAVHEKRFDAACQAIKGKNYKTAHQHLRKLDKANHGKGQTVLGLLYEKGVGVERDLAKAVSLYQKGAAKGIPQAESRLGHLLLSMEDAVAMDSKGAIYWIERAAEHGVEEAQLTLGKLYTEGKHLPINHSKAVYYLHNAAAQGNDEAQRMLDNIPQLRQAHQAMLAGGSQYQSGMNNLGKSWTGYADIVNNLNAASSYSAK
jgi:FOG: TPR repeat, SEL1 subfamily